MHYYQCCKNKSICLSLVVKAHNELVNKMYVIVNNHAMFIVDEVQSYYSLLLLKAVVKLGGLCNLLFLA